MTAWSPSPQHQYAHLRDMWLASRHVPVPMRLIAAGKLLKAVGFLLLALMVAHVLHMPDAQATLNDWLRLVHIDPEGEKLHQVLETITPHTLRLVGIGAFAYAGLYLVEGLGLWFGRYWAAWLTLIATGFYLPLEIHHLIRHPSLGITVTLVLNLLVVGYLGWRIKARSHPVPGG
jgi:uncharacterized membrane protein (DUF2068 family)